MSVFFFNDTATTEIYTLALHDALPIYDGEEERGQRADEAEDAGGQRERRHARVRRREVGCRAAPVARSGHDRRLGPRLDREEHTSELQSRQYLVCRLLLEKIKQNDPFY